MPCDLSPPISGDEVTLILWFKGPTGSGGEPSPEPATGKPIYSIDARSSPASSSLQRARQLSLSDAMANRVVFSWNAKPMPVLIVRDVIGDDDGLYQCRVDWRWARTTHTYSELKVIGKK